MPKPYRDVGLDAAGRPGPTPNGSLPPSPWAAVWLPRLTAIFAATAAAAAVSLAFPGLPPGVARWMDSLFWLAAAATASAGLARRLATQNVVAIVFIVASVSLCVNAAVERTGFPLGRRVFEAPAGARLLGVPWPVPLVWVAVLLSARDLARLILRPWRLARAYGWALLGLASLLSASLCVGWEAFGAGPRGWWRWTGSGTVPAWFPAPWTNYAGWMGISFLVLLLASPWFLNKQPVKQRFDLHPLFVWLVLSAYLAAGAVFSGLWPVLAWLVGLGGATGWLAVRGAAWKPPEP